jgi:hypothetical protein
MTADKYRNSYDMAAKADWEGGFSGLVLEYGLSLNSLPDDLPGYIRDAVIRCIDAKEDFELVDNYLRNALDHCPYPDGWED